MGQGEDQMEVGHRQELCAAGLEPALLRQCLALRAVAVAAGMVTGHFCAAVITGLQMATEDRRTAVLRWPASRGVVGRRGYGYSGTPPRIPGRSPPTRKVRPQPPAHPGRRLSGRGVPRALENVAGRREILDHHPLVQQTLRDCLSEAMDIEGLERLLAEIARGETRVIARDLTEPSPLISKDIET